MTIFWRIPGVVMVGFTVEEPMHGRIRMLVKVNGKVVLDRPLTREESVLWEQQRNLVLPSVEAQTI